MDVNKTVYRVTDEHNGVSKTVPLIWDPIDLSVEPPQPPMLKQDIMSIYYYMTNFSMSTNDKQCIERSMVNSRK